MWKHQFYKTDPHKVSRALLFKLPDFLKPKANFGAMPGKKLGSGTPTKVVRNVTPSSDKFQKFPDGRVLCLTCNKNRWIVLRVSKSELFT